jgi:hypothetical protein
MGHVDDQVVKFFKASKNFLVKLLSNHKFYEEVYVKNGGKSYYGLDYIRVINITHKSLKGIIELIEKEIILLAEVGIITKNEEETLKNMILHTEDADNVLIGMLLLKKHRKLLDKKLKDPIFESEFITNIACDYYNKIHKPYMDRKLNSIKNK